MLMDRESERKENQKSKSALMRFLCLFLFAAGAALHGRADAICETNCFTVETGNCPTLVYNKNRAVRFEVRSYGSNGWFVVDASLRGSAYVANVPLGQEVLDHYFSYHSHSLDSSAITPPSIFRFAFLWEHTLEESHTILRHYGWASLTTNAVGDVVVLACEVADVHGLPVVGRGEPDLPVVPSGPDDIEVLSENPDDIIRQWDFTAKYDCNSIYTVPGIEGYFVRGGDVHAETRTNFNGRSCVKLSTYKQCMTSWFSINKTGYWVQHMAPGAESWIEYVGEYHKPALYDAIGVALRLWADVPCTTAQAPHTEFPVNGVDWFRELFEYSETLPDMPEPSGAVIHVDDKMWLRYLASEDGGICKTNWQACAGLMDASSNIVERTVELKAAVESAALPSPVGAWTTIRIEAENAASPSGLGFRLWIGGVAAASADGATVFYARPSATNRTGVAALGVGGNAYLDDLTFFEKHRNPLDGVHVSSWDGPLSGPDIKNLAAILGEDSISGVTLIDARTCDTPQDYGAAQNCIRLGITPKETEIRDHGEYGKEMILKFRNPTVTITDLDFAAGKITARVIPEEGTRIAIPPLPYMFGLTEVYNLGTSYVGTCEYGDCFSRGDEGFSVDLSNYPTANGEFTLQFPKWLVPDYKPIFFKVQLKEYEHK